MATTEKLRQIPKAETDKKRPHVHLPKTVRQERHRQRNANRRNEFPKRPRWKTTPFETTLDF